MPTLFTNQVQQSPTLDIINVRLIILPHDTVTNRLTHISVA